MTEILGERTPGQHVAMAMAGDPEEPHPFARLAAALRSKYRRNNQDLPGNVIEVNVYDVVATISEMGFVHQPLPGPLFDQARASDAQYTAIDLIRRALSNLGFHRDPYRAGDRTEYGSIDVYFIEVSGAHAYRATLNIDGRITDLGFKADSHVILGDQEGWEDSRGTKAWDRIITAGVQSASH